MSKVIFVLAFSTMLPLSGIAQDIFAMKCEALQSHEHEGRTLLLYPRLIVDEREGLEQAVFMALDGESAEPEFGDRMCQACGWGSKHSYISFYKETVNGNNSGVYAFFDPKGTLTKLQMIRGEASLQILDSLTCDR